jgi:D-aspartate ligase
MNSFVPLLFAGDINVYSMARAFHELYGIKPKVYGKYEALPCQGSKIMDYTADPEVDRQSVFFPTVVRFAEDNKDKKVLLIGCGDSYVQLISANKARFPKNVVVPYIDIDLMNDLIHKEKFYSLCQEAGVPYPKTFIHRKGMEKDETLPFEPPFIAKPSNGIEYWKHPFPGQKKVYKADTREELEEILTAIYGAGYEDSMVLQEFIPGDDTFMRVLTNYSDQYGRVRLMCLGHVLLEEHTPHGIGNHAVIVTEQNLELEEKMKALLERLEYVGFSNFDIKYDQRDDTYKVFEINTRQGRSNYYVTGAGANIVQYLVEDWIHGHPIDFRSVDKEFLWMVVPKGVAFRWIKPTEYRTQMRRLIREGNWVNPLLYNKDRGLARSMKLNKSLLGHYFKFWKYRNG